MEQQLKDEMQILELDQRIMLNEMEILRLKQRRTEILLDSKKNTLIGLIQTSANNTQLQQVQEQPQQENATISELQQPTIITQQEETTSQPINSTVLITDTIEPQEVIADPQQEQLQQVQIFQNLDNTTQIDVDLSKSESFEQTTTLNELSKMLDNLW